MIITILSIFAVVFIMNLSFYLIFAKSGSHNESNKNVVNQEDNSSRSINADNNNDSRGADNNDSNHSNDNNHNNNATSVQNYAKLMIPVQQNIQTTPITSDPNLVSVPERKNCAKNLSERPNPIEYLTYFNCGHVHILSNGTVLRQFSLIISENNVIPISDIQSKDPVLFNAWTFNNTIPGPTMRMTEGDHVEITVYNSNSSKHPHSLHMHSIHPGMIDGVYGMAGSILPGGHYTYSFTASPAGLYPYHCHVSPVQTHINHGLYGAIIIDPKLPRSPAKEMVMLMNGYNLKDDYSSNESAAVLRPPTAAELRTNFEKATESEGVSGADNNQIYSVNGPAFIYRDHPIQLVTGQPYRIYLLNMLEFDKVNSFHLHGNMFEYYPAGTGMSPSYRTDIVELGQGDRGIIEFNYTQPGLYMFHAHINEFTDLGWMGMFNVQDRADAVSTMLPANHSVLPTFPSSPAFLPNIVQTPKADMNGDVSGNGRAATFDGKNSISSAEKGFCNNVDNTVEAIAGCKSSSFSNNPNPRQFTVDYSIIKDPVTVGDATYMSITVRDKYTDEPISDVLVLLTIEPPNSNPYIDKTTTRTTHTDKDGHATFTVQIGPRSSTGIYNTNLEIRKDSYDSKLQKVFHVL